MAFKEDFVSTDKLTLEQSEQIDSTTHELKKFSREIETKENKEQSIPDFVKYKEYAKLFSKYFKGQSLEKIKKRIGESEEDIIVDYNGNTKKCIKIEIKYKGEKKSIYITNDPHWSQLWKQIDDYSVVNIAICELSYNNLKSLSVSGDYTVGDIIGSIISEELYHLEENNIPQVEEAMSEVILAESLGNKALLIHFSSMIKDLTKKWRNQERKVKQSYQVMYDFYEKAIKNIYDNKKGIDNIWNKCMNNKNGIVQTIADNIGKEMDKINNKYSNRNIDKKEYTLWQKEMFLCENTFRKSIFWDIWTSEFADAVTKEYKRLVIEANKD